MRKVCAIALLVSAAFGCGDDEPIYLSGIFLNDASVVDGGTDAGTNSGTPFDGGMSADGVGADTPSPADVLLLDGPSPDAPGTTAFGAKVDFPVGTTPSGVVLGDLNGDDKIDLAVLNVVSGDVSVLLNTTAARAAVPTFSSKVDFPTGPGPNSQIAIGDLNMDGKLDLAVANGGVSKVSVLLNTTAAGATTASFASKFDVVTNGNAVSVVIRDLNADGKPDLAVANSGANTAGPKSVSVYLNTTTAAATTPSFSAKVEFTVAGAPSSIVADDINVDGKPDLAVASSGAVSVLLNTTDASAATPSFAAKADFVFDGGATFVVIGDLNGDQKLDLVCAGNPGGVRFNTTTTGATTATFAPWSPFGEANASYWAVAIGDLDGDAKPDIIATDIGTNQVSIFHNATAIGATVPSFAARTDYPSGMAPYGVAIGDFNADGHPDLATVNGGSNTVSILLLR